MTSQPLAAAPETSPMFEDLAVGQRFTSGPRTFGADRVRAYGELTGDTHPLHTSGRDGAPATVHGSMVVAEFFGWHHEVGLSEYVEAAADSNWEFLAPVAVGSSVTYELTITRLRRASSLRNGVVGRTVLVRDTEGRTVARGTSTAIVTARSSGDDRTQRAGEAWPSREWVSAMADALGVDPDFTEATSTWDGSIGLDLGGDLVQFRVYRGRVLDAGTRTPQGPTFTVHASDLTWAELFTGPANDFMRRQMAGQFAASGSAYEYQRATRAVVALIDTARRLAGTEG